MQVGFKKTNFEIWLYILGLSLFFFFFFDIKTIQAQDTTPPDAVSDLSTSNATYYSVDLTWTEQSDDNGPTGEGNVSSYIVKYAASQILNETDFGNATTYSQSWTSLSPGSNHTESVDGLVSDATYYFSIKSCDEVPNCSGISNSPSATTINPSISFSISAILTDFESLDDSAINISSPNITLTTTTNAVNGYKIYVRDQGDESNPGLWSVSADNLITSTTTLLSIGTEGYGIQASSDSAIIANPYNVTGNNVGALSRTLTLLASNSESVSSEAVTVTHKAAILNITEAGLYADIITYTIFAEF